MSENVGKFDPTNPEPEYLYTFDLRKMYLTSEKAKEWARLLKESNSLYRMLWFTTAVKEFEAEPEKLALCVEVYLKCYKNAAGSKLYSFISEDLPIFKTAHGGRGGGRRPNPDGSGEPGKIKTIADGIRTDMMNSWWGPFKVFLKLDEPKLFKRLGLEYSNFGDLLASNDWTAWGKGPTLNAWNARPDHRKTLQYKLIWMLRFHLEREELNKKADGPIAKWLSEKFERDKSACRSMLGYLDSVYTIGNMTPAGANPGTGQPKNPNLDVWYEKIVHIHNSLFEDQDELKSEERDWRKMLEKIFEGRDKNDMWRQLIESHFFQDYVEKPEENGQANYRLLPFQKPEAEDDDWEKFFHETTDHIIKRGENLVGNTRIHYWWSNEYPFPVYAPLFPEESI